MDEREFAEQVSGALDELSDEMDISSTTSFDAAGLLTRNEGFVVLLNNGDEFQVSVIQSKVGNDEPED